MALVGSLVVTVSARTEDFEKGMQKTTTVLKLTQQQADEAAKGFGALSGIITQTAQRATTSASGFDTASRSLRQTKQASDDAGGGLEKLSGFFVKAAAAGVALAVAKLSLDAIKAGIEGMLASAGKADALQRAFTAITGSAQVAGQQLGFVRGVADRLGLSFGELAQGFKGIDASARNTSLEGLGIQKVFLDIVTAGARLGLTTAEVNGVLLAFQQILSKGKVTAEDFNQISERLPGSINAGARALGVATAEFARMREAGELVATQFLPKFATRFLEDVGGASTQAVDTAQAAFARLGNEFERLKTRIANSGLAKIVKDIVGAMAEVLRTGNEAADRAEQRTKGRVAEVLQQPGGRTLVATAAEAEKLLKITENLTSVEDRMQEAVAAGAPKEVLAQIQAYIDGLRQQQTELQAAIRLRASISASFAPGQDQYVEDRSQAIKEAAQARIDANTRLEDALKKTAKAQDDLNQKAALFPELFQGGEKPIDDQLTLLQARAQLLKTELEKIATIVLQRAPGTGPVPADIATKEGELRTGLTAVQASITALQEKKKALAEAAQAAETAARLEKQAAESAGEAVVQARLKVNQQVNEALADLQRLNEKYTLTPGERDQDKAARLVALTVSDETTHALALEQQANIAVGIALKEKAEALQKVADASFAEMQIRMKSTEALRAYQEQLELSGGALDAFGRVQKTTAEARAVTQAEARLRNLPPELQGEGADVVSRLRLLAREAEPQFKRLMQLSEGFADSFLSTMERATEGGIKSFKDFAQSVIQDLIRLANQTYLKPALQSVVQSGLTAIAGLFGPTTTTGGTLQGPTASGATLDTMAPARAEGGPVMPGRFYRVGERGVETIFAASSGYVLPHGSLASQGQGQQRQLPPVVVNIYGAQDLRSFQRGRAEINRGIAQAVQQAQRAM